MPTLLQLQSEAAWRSEFTPPALIALGARLSAFFRIPALAIGTRGNTAHLSGYHRSRRWVRTSAYCVSRTYSVSRTAGDRTGGSDDAVSAMDMTLPTAQLLAACQRLDVAVRAGRLEKITEWYGNRDGDQRVDGYDNISNRVASSDPSHVWHVHMSFDRGRVDEDHTDVYEVLTGEDMPTPQEIAAAVWNFQIASPSLERTAKAADWLKAGYGLERTLPARLDAILAAALDDDNTTVVLAPEALAELTQIRDQLAALPEAVRPVIDEELDEQSRAGADADQ